MLHPEFEDTWPLEHVNADRDQRDAFFEELDQETEELLDRLTSRPARRKRD